MVKKLGKDRISKIYEFADVYHCENIEAVSDNFIKDAGIVSGKFDNVADCGYAVPSHWDIGKVYKRLIKMVAEDEKIGIVDALIEVYNSFISPKIEVTIAVFITKIPIIFLNVIEKKKCYNQKSH